MILFAESIVSSYYLGEIIKRDDFLNVRAGISMHWSILRLSILIFKGDELVFSAESKNAVYQILMNMPNIRKLKMFLQDISGICY
jgi:hypothetical protein